MRPLSTEYAPYYQRYMDQIKENENVMELLSSQMAETTDLMTNMPAVKADYRYAEGKWSVKEVFGHIIDTERIMAYRALCIARGETSHLPGFDQDDYVTSAGFDTREMTNMISEFKYQRMANIALFNSYSDEVLTHMGTANSYNISVRALIYVIAAHERHHIHILKERYL